jgi:hypothetical protein
LTPAIADYTPAVEIGKLFQNLSPHARVATAVAPFVLAMVARLFFGGNRTTGWLITAGTAWFVVNVFLAPYSPQMRQDILSIRSWLP